MPCPGRLRAAIPQVSALRKFAEICGIIFCGHRLVDHSSVSRRSTRRLHSTPRKASLRASMKSTPGARAASEPGKSRIYGHDAPSGPLQTRRRIQGPGQARPPFAPISSRDPRPDQAGISSAGTARLQGGRGLTTSLFIKFQGVTCALDPEKRSPDPVGPFIGRLFRSLALAITY